MISVTVLMNFQTWRDPRLPDLIPVYMDPAVNDATVKAFNKRIQKTQELVHGYMDPYEFSPENRKIQTFFPKRQMRGHKIDKLIIDESEDVL